MENGSDQQKKIPFEEDGEVRQEANNILDRFDKLGLFSSKNMVPTDDNVPVENPLKNTIRGWCLNH